MSVLTLPEAEDLAARTLTKLDTAINHMADVEDHYTGGLLRLVRERVASDLAGLRECYSWPTATPYVRETRVDVWPLMLSHARRYSENLHRTAALYGVTP